jgi:bifunctional UDP-N-acetylglucosamine pyrophosphorylase/glucosamine-1-phosphate N-acetyltransferase
MLSGVTIVDPGSTFIDSGVEIGMDTVIYPGTIIEGLARIGEDCIIGPNSRLVDAKVGNNTVINNSIVLESSIGDDVQMGPFAYIRPGSIIGNKAKIGDFVEVKKSIIGNRTKVPHLAYIGDTEIGENTNIACGVVTVNYDGKKKSKTHIGSNAFVGCNVNLIAPVTVRDNSYIAAGSTITEEVPENALAIARSRQVNKEDWVIKRHKEGV